MKIISFTQTYGEQQQAFSEASTVGFTQRAAQVLRINSAAFTLSIQDATFCI